MFSACAEPEVSDNTRLVVKGKIVDTANHPLPRITVGTKAYTYDLGGDVTDNQGRFEFTSLASNAKTFEIHINKKPVSFSDTTTTAYRSDYSSVSYIFFTPAFQQTYALAATKLRQTAILDFKIQKTPTSTDTLVGHLNFKRPECYRYIGDEPAEYENKGCYKTVSVSPDLTPESPNFEQQFRSLLNTEAVFTYHINSGNEQSVAIPLNETSTTYVFSY